MIGLSTPVPGLERHETVVNTSHNKISFLIICQPKWVSWQVFVRLPKHEECCWPDRKKFTEEDIQVLVDKIASYPITEKMNFGELWKRRTRAQMISLEEGVLEKWFFGRIVMAGDALHKVSLTLYQFLYQADLRTNPQVTPNSGLGGSTAMEDAVSIANAIHKLIASHPDSKPTHDEIRDVLQRYQNARIRRVKKIVKTGGEMTRKQAYDGWMNYFQYRWMLPMIGMDYIAQQTARLCVGAPKLSYIEFDEKHGLWNWRDTSLEERGIEKTRGSMQRTLWYPTHLFTSLVLIVVVAIAGVLLAGTQSTSWSHFYWYY
jgi:hypothetical protein